ncbi:MAG: hypothetical protein GOU99_02285 [Candidatus Altiarchaeota archaeon]|nr:hypothetical protein [Candidatus Altiarchaeota archaeon]
MKLEIGLFSKYPKLDTKHPETKSYLKQVGWEAESFVYGLGDTDLKLNFTKNVSKILQAALLFYDCTSTSTVEEAEKFYQEIISTTNKIPIVLIGTTHEHVEHCLDWYNTVSDRAKELFETINENQDNAMHYQVSTGRGYAIDIQAHSEPIYNFSVHENLSAPLAKLREFLV